MSCYEDYNISYEWLPHLLCCLCTSTTEAMSPLTPSKAAYSQPGPCHHIFTESHLLQRIQRGIYVKEDRGYVIAVSGGERGRCSLLYDQQNIHVRIKYATRNGSIFVDQKYELDGHRPPWYESLRQNIEAI